MKQILFYIALAAALAAVLGCTTTTTTGAPAPDLDARVAEAIHGLVGAYERRDVPGFMALVSARYLTGYGEFQAALEDSLATVVSATVDVRPERVWETEDGMVLVDAGWSKTVTRGGAPGTDVTFGRVTLIFVRHQPDVLKLLSQKGDTVFP